MVISKNQPNSVTSRCPGENSDELMAGNPDVPFSSSTKPACCAPSAMLLSHFLNADKLSACGEVTARVLGPLVVFQGAGFQS